MTKRKDKDKLKIRDSFRKLSFDQVVEIRQGAADGESAIRLGDLFDIPPVTVARILKMTEWNKQKLPQVVGCEIPENPPGEAKEYRDIVGFDGTYKIGDNGEVWSRHDETLRRSCRGWQRLAPCLGVRGYLVYSFRKQTGKGIQSKTIVVHKLLMDAFKGPRPKGLVCRHLDDDKMNNHLDNLVWGTQKENCEDSVRNGKTVTGESHPSSKLTEDKIREIRRRVDGGECHRHIAKDFGISQSTVSLIGTRKRWKHIDD